MSKRHSPSGLRYRLIEMLERRWLLSAAIQAEMVSLQSQLAAAGGDIYGVVVRDANHNFLDDQLGVDNPDPSMEGVRVYIDTNDNRKFDAPTEPSTTTDVYGNYRLSTNLPSGTYHVREIVPAGFRQVSQEGTLWEFEDQTYSYQLSFLNTDFVGINGTSGADQILVEPDPAGMRVTINGAARVQSLTGVGGLWVLGKAGDDRITIDPGILLPTRIEGGEGANTIIASGGTDRIWCGSGNDSIYAGAAKDVIDAGAGNDVIDGGAGNDSVLGNAGDNSINGGTGNDTLYGNTGNDSINGGAGNDIIYASDGNDCITGGTGDDSLYGDAGNDSINAGAGNDFIDDRIGLDLIAGGAGDDLFHIKDSRLILDGGLGIDQLTFHGKKSPKKITGVETSVRYVAPSKPRGVNYGGLGGGWCFLTTAVVGWAGKADDCPELTLLRRFRDTYMRGLPDGPDLIRDYYAHAPRVVRAIEGNGLGGIEWPRVSTMIQAAIQHIQAGRNAQALAVYAAEYLRLKARYV